MQAAGDLGHVWAVIVGPLSDQKVRQESAEKDQEGPSAGGMHK